MATILKEFDISFASDYLETVKMSEIEETPRYRSSLTLPMVSRTHFDMLKLIVGVCSWSLFVSESRRDQARFQLVCNKFMIMPHSCTLFTVL